MPVIQALVALYERLALSEDPQRRLPEVGWQEREITFLVDLNPDGTPVAFSLLRETQAKGRRRAPLLLVPQEPKRKGPLPETATEKDCGRSSLFWDHPKYALGLPTEDGAKAIRDAEVCHGLFRLRHQQFAREGGAGIRNDAGMRALLSFLDRGATSGLSAIKPGWTNEVRESSGYVAFRLHGDRELVCRRSPIRAAISTQATSEDNSAVGQCLATGHTTRITRLHPSVQGVTGGLSTGAKLVTFNAPAAESHGLVQGENAPIGVYAAFAYTTALNKLLRHDSTSVARAGATTVVFWAGQETANEAVLCNLMSSMTAEEEWCAGTGGVADLLTAVRPGAPPPVEDNTPFFILALSAESGPRVTVRFFHQTTIAETACAISDWFEQSAIVPVDSPPLSLTVLLRALSPQGDIKYSTPLIGSEVLRSAYTGAPLPHQSLTVALLRSAAERGPTLERVALMKAFLVRNKRWRITVGLDPEELDPAYRLGRLFAVLEGIQTAARRSNRTIRDSYWSAASSMPATTFPHLIDLGIFHLMKIKQDRIALAIWFEQQIEAITAPLPAALPSLLTVERQGRFAIGYWHQRYARRPGSAAAEEAAPLEAIGDIL